MPRQIYISRENFIPRWNLCITRRIHASLKFRHREKSSYLAEIYASRKDFMPRQIFTSWEDFLPRWNLFITRTIHASLKIMHPRNHASRKIMHRESIIMHDEKISCLIKIHTAREDFIPRWNLEIARRVHTLPKFMHHEKNPCLIEICASREDFDVSPKVMHCEKISYLAGIYVSREDIYAPQEDIHE